MSPHGSDQKDVFKFRKSIEYIVKIAFLQTEKFTVVSLSGNEMILVNYLKYETDVSEVASFFQSDRGPREDGRDLVDLSVEARKLFV